MKALKFLFLIIFCLGFTNLDAQINLKDKLKRQTNNRANKNVDQGINKSLDAVEGGVKDLFKKKNKDEKDSTTVDQKQGNASSEGSKQSLKAYSVYDFVPGDQVLLYEDFSQDAVGDFPALWTTDVAGEVNTLNIGPGNWFNLNSTEGTYWFMKDIDFPKNFILEMDIVPKIAAPRFAADVVFFGEGSHSEMDKNGDPGTCGLHIKIEKNIWETAGYKKGVQEKRTAGYVFTMPEEKYWMCPPIFTKEANFHVCVSNFTAEPLPGRIFPILKLLLLRLIPEISF
jgi:OOP family OmpA-OmpF porin